MMIFEVIDVEDILSVLAFIVVVESLSQSFSLAHKL